jgi:hypothetical protein
MQIKKNWNWKYKTNRVFFFLVLLVPLLLPFVPLLGLDVDDCCDLELSIIVIEARFCNLLFASAFTKKL